MGLAILVGYFLLVRHLIKKGIIYHVDDLTNDIHVNDGARSSKLKWFIIGSLFRG